MPAIRWFVMQILIQSCPIISGKFSSGLYEIAGSEREVNIPVVKRGGNCLLGSFAIDQSHQPRQHFSKLSLGPSHPHQDIRFADSHTASASQHLDLLIYIWR